MRKLFDRDNRVSYQTSPAHRLNRNVRDKVVPVLRLLQATKGHLRTGDVFLGVLEVFELEEEKKTSVTRAMYVYKAVANVAGAYQSVLVPDNVGLLVGIGVGEAFDGTGVTAEETVEVGADLVGATVFNGVALGAARLQMESAKHSQLLPLFQQCQLTLKRPAPL